MLPRTWIISVRGTDHERDTKYGVTEVDLYILHLRI